MQPQTASLTSNISSILLLISLRLNDRTVHRFLKKSATQRTTQFMKAISSSGSKHWSRLAILLRQLSQLVPHEYQILTALFPYISTNAFKRTEMVISSPLFTRHPPILCSERPSSSIITAKGLSGALPTIVNSLQRSSGSSISSTTGNRGLACTDSLSWDIH